MTTHPKLTARNLEKREAAKNRKGFTLALSFKQVVLYSTVFIVCLSWMFIFGILVGRGLPLVSSEDVSMRAQLLRFLGLEREAPKPVEKAAETWQSPQKMLESLNYYEELTQKNSPSPAKNQASAGSPATSSPAKDSPLELARKQQSLPVPLSPQERPSATDAEKAVTSKTPQEGSAAEAAAEHFTLLVASLKDVENAQRLVDQLRTKGYAPRLQLLDLNGGGHWNRVLVGSFGTRESALKFAAEFNKKERMEALVIRESN